MAKMSELYIDIEEMLMDEMSVDDIVERTGVPLAWVLQVKQNIIDSSMDYINSKSFRCSD